MLAFWGRADQEAEDQAEPKLPRRGENKEPDFDSVKAKERDWA